MKKEDRMMNEQHTYSPLMNLIRLSQPLALVEGVLLYALGAGIAHFLGNSIDWTTYWVGQATVTFLQLTSYYLKAYYDTPQPEENDSPVENKPNSINSQTRGQLSRSLVLQSALITMTVGAVLTVMLLVNGSIQLPAFIFLGLGLLLAFFYAVPPFRLVYSGYGELSMAIIMTNLIPALSYLFQVGDLHRVLAMVTFPLTALYITTAMALSLRKYGADARYDRKTLMVRMGWQRAMNFHNILILVAYLLFAAGASLGLPWVLTWPALLTLPIGLFQIWQMSQIARGAKPRWNVLYLTAVATLGLTVYLLNLSLWTH
jgi:1,4-dihydroxy-2-naphthoate octaprenyltransferase